MSTRTQDKFLAAMERLADERQLELVVDHEWANKGTYSFQRRGSFEPVLEIPFEFQHGYSCFDRASRLGRSPKGGSWGYVQGAEHDALIERVAKVLDEALAENSEAPA